MDLSPTALAWAEDRAREAGADIRFHRGDAFALTTGELGGPYELVYDSGCFHHLPPHRRISYLALLERTLAPGGHSALICFAAGRMGSELPDAAFYRDARLHGGVAYTAEALRRMFRDLTEVELRHMRQEPSGPRCSGSPSSGRPCSAVTPDDPLRARGPYATAAKATPTTERRNRRRGGAAVTGAPSADPHRGQDPGHGAPAAVPPTAAVRQPRKRAPLPTPDAGRRLRTP